MLGMIPNKIPDAGSNIRSIQSGTQLMTAAAENVTINTVNTEKSIVIITCAASPDATYGDVPENVTVRGSLTNSTTLALVRDNNASDVYVYWQVVEFQNVKSLQTGSKSLTDVTDTVTINPVDTEKCLLFVSLMHVSANEAHASFGAVLTNSTTISFRCYINATTNIFDWQLIEFK